jgi:hypothetical protein
MGFRDLHAFNLAMLAKQSWRLINNPNSLCAQVLGAKYYPDGMILNAGPKKGSSFTWRSIVAGLQTLRRGHIWRVGNGRSINIWKDHWVPAMASRKIDTLRGRVVLSTVDKLIDPLTGTWDEAQLSEIFNPLDVQRILQIPLSPNMEDDFIAWNCTKNYQFSVRSAYYLEWNHQYGSTLRRADGQGTMNKNPVWEIVWKLKVPAKIKIFSWRALHGLIPGVGVLANRHIKVSPECPICKQGSEDIMHLMFTCRRAKKVWRALGLDAVINQAVSQDKSGSVVFEEILRSPNKKSPVIGQLGLQETIAVAAWYIWWQRREAVKGESVAPAARSSFSIQALTLNYGSVSSSSKEKAVRWIKPPARQYKLNVDAAYYSTGLGAVAAIIRNDHGEAIAGGAIPMTNIMDAATAEALAMQFGLQMVENMGCSPVTAESDCLELINACTGVIELWSPYTAILADCFQIASIVGHIKF